MNSAFTTRKHLDVHDKTGSREEMILKQNIKRKQNITMSYKVSLHVGSNILGLHSLIILA